MIPASGTGNAFYGGGFKSFKKVSERDRKALPKIDVDGTIQDDFRVLFGKHLSVLLAV